MGPISPVAGPPLAPPQMMGIAPPPVGPRLPDPNALADVRAGLTKLMDASEKDPLVAAALKPVIQSLFKVNEKLMNPPKPSSAEAGANAEPLDQTPIGDVAGTPLQALIPQLAGVGMR